MFKCDFNFEIPDNHSNIKKILNINFNLKNNSVVALTGPNGSGKTTVLKLISGLIKPLKGYIKFKDITWFDSYRKINLSVQKRRVGFVFQETALLPFLTIENNIKFVTKNPNQTVLSTLIDITNLSKILKCFPYQLSGGQKQKVAIIQALIKETNLLLLDEPFSNIDKESTILLQKYILILQEEYNFPIIISTHSNSDIYNFSNEEYKLF